MTVEQLRSALAELAQDAEVVVVYEAGCCESEDMTVSVENGRVMLDVG